jgi:sec-independent protein translocase protein TatB
MFNIGGGEFLVIALVALIVLGPQRLPDAARQAGKAMGELRRLSSGFQNELKGAFAEPDAAPARPAPRRTPLTAAPATDESPAVEDAIASVSDQRPARRAPLRAAPATRAPRVAAPAKEAPSAPEAGRPPSKGS